jgi:hypothetical protein
LKNVPLKNGLKNRSMIDSENPCSCRVLTLTSDAEEGINCQN